MDRLEAAASSYDQQRCLYPHCTATVPLQFYQLHINYCRIKWEGSLVTCPYNSTHRYGEPEDSFHRHLCPNKPRSEKDSKSDIYKNFLEALSKSNCIISDNETPIRSGDRCPPKIATLTSCFDLFPAKSMAKGSSGNGNDDNRTASKRNDNVKNGR